MLPNDHIVLVGGGRATSADVDGVVIAMTPDGKPETSFSDSGFETFDLSGPADFLWGVALSPSQTRLVAVGIKGATTNTSNDDAVQLSVPREDPLPRTRTGDGLVASDRRLQLVSHRCED